MSTLGIGLTAIVALLLLLLWLSIKIVKQYEQGGVFWLGRVTGAREPGLRAIIPFVDEMHRVSKRIVTRPPQSSPRRHHP